MNLVIDNDFEQIKRELKDLIILACDVKDIKPQDILDDDLLINGDGVLRIESLDAVEIVVAIQRRYGVRIKDISSARKHMRSVSSLATYIVEDRAAHS